MTWMSFEVQSGWTRFCTDHELGSIFLIRGLVGAAFLGYLFLLLIKFSGKILNAQRATRRVEGRTPEIKEVTRTRCIISLRSKESISV